MTASLALLLALTSQPLERYGDGPPRPNVVVLLADDLGFRDVGCYGGPVKTPHIDSLAAGGTRFTNFYSGCAVCSPSRASLLTGRHHIRTGVYSWIRDDQQRSHLRLREVTLAEMLKDAGYATAHIGKWHLGLPSDKYDKPTPDRHGFDHWFATWNNAEPSHRNPKNFIRNGTPVGQLEGYSCQLVADEAIGWIERHTKANREQPFFTNIWFHEPHAPIAAPDDIVDDYGKLTDKGAVYSGTIDNTDRAIGRLLDALDHLSDDTLIVYASDNGSYRADRVGELRGRKGANWEGGIRVPGLFHWPGHIREGQALDEPAGVVDITPTIAGLLDLPHPTIDGQRVHWDGTSLAPLLIDSYDSFERRQPLFWHLQRSRPIVAMRSGRFSLVAERDYDLPTDNLFQEQWIPAIKTGGYTNFQLFDLAADVGQTSNVINDYPDVAETMKRQLLRINASIMKDGADWHDATFAP